MKTALWIFLIGCLCLNSCKKDKKNVPFTDTTSVDTTDSTVKVADFYFLPTKDASWRFHYQGSYLNNSQYPWRYFYDTSAHIYTDIIALGRDTFLKGTKYALYSFKGTEYYYGRYSYYTGLLYIKEDTVSKTVKSLGYDELDFNQKEGDSVSCCYRWPTGIIESGDSIEIDGVMHPALYVRVKDKKYFYLCRGIGSMSTFAKGHGFSAFDIYGKAGTWKSLDFTYKGQSFHFEYDLNP